MLTELIATRRNVKLILPTTGQQQTVFSLRALCSRCLHWRTPPSRLPSPQSHNEAIVGRSPFFLPPCEDAISALYWQSMPWSAPSSSASQCAPRLNRSCLTSFAVRFGTRCCQCSCVSPSINSSEPPPRANSIFGRTQQQKNTQRTAEPAGPEWLQWREGARQAYN